jgi:glycosyltransferase involved in cell wall biosynthesis
MRVDNVEQIHGKGFSEAETLSKNIAFTIFLCFTDKMKGEIRKITPQLLFISVPLTITNSVIQTLRNLVKGYFGLFQTLRFLKKQYNINLLRAENTLMSGLPTFLFSVFGRVKYGIWLGGSEEEGIKIRYGSNPLSRLLIVFVRFLKRLVFRRAKFVLCVNDELIENARRLGARAIIKTPNFVDFDKFTSSPVKQRDAVHFLYLGRLEQEKGLKYLLEAARLLAGNPKVKIQIVGKGGMENLVQHYATTIENLSYLGFFGHDEIPRILKQADVLLLPSLTEGVPASVLEAMASGLPVIASAVGGIPSLIEDKIHGLLLPPGDVEALKQAILKLADDVTLRNNLGNRSRERAISLSGDYIRLHLQLYKQTISNS